MNKPGRNDPCYCGSGKKYKQCHMAADLAAEREQHARLEAARFLRGELLEFAREERFAADADEVLPRFWNELYTTDNADEMSDSEIERFYDWLAFDHTLSQDEADKGRRVIDVYQEEKKASLTAPQQALLDEWVKAGPLSAYELTSYEKQELHLKEVVSDEEIQVYEPSGHGEAPLGSLILGRVVPVDDHLEFSSMPAYIAPNEITDLLEKLTAALGEDGETGSDFKAFMRRHNTLLIHHALEEAQKAGRPPVDRLDPHRPDRAVRQRISYKRLHSRGGPGGRGKSLPQMIQTRRKAIG